MASESPLVSVILPCRNEVDHIAQCLGEVLRFEVPKGGFEVLVADGMSDDGTRGILDEVCREDPRVRVIDNLGFTTPFGLNAAISAARGEVIVRVDAHTRYAQDYLVRCLEVLRETQADNVGGPARTEATGFVQRAVAAAFHSRFSVGGASFHDVAFEGTVDTVTYGCWPRATFERFGLFDEELVRNQDDEHNLRINRAGGTVWQSPRIRSWYSPRGSLGELFRQYRQYGYWKVRVIQKHRVPASWRHLVPGAFVALFTVLAVLAPFSSRVALGFFGLGASYLVAVLVATGTTAAKSGWELSPFLPFVFPVYHFGYGAGFLAGVFDFIVLRKAPSDRWKRLSRGVVTDANHEVASDKEN